MPFEADCFECILPYKKCIKGQRRKRLWGVTWPIMLCMHELAFTRSEPEAQMNPIRPKSDALEVLGSVEEPLKGTLSEESHILKTLGWSCYSSPGMETACSILMSARLMFMSWYHHTRGFLFYHKYYVTTPQGGPRSKGVASRAAAENGKAGSTGRQQDLFEHPHPWRATGFFEWYLTNFYRAKHFDFCEISRIDIVTPTERRKQLRKVTLPKAHSQRQNSKPVLLSPHIWHSTKSFNEPKRGE